MGLRLRRNRKHARRKRAGPDGFHKPTGSFRTARTTSSLTLPGRSIAHRVDRCFVPVEVQPDVGTALAARLANESRLKIRQPEVIRPSVAAERDRIAAMVVATIDQHAANA